MTLKPDKRMTLSEYAAAVGLHCEELARLAGVPALTVRMADRGHPIALVQASKLLAALSKEHGKPVRAEDIGNFHTC